MAHSTKITDPQEPRVAKEGAPFFVPPAIIAGFSLLIGWHNFAWWCLVLALLVGLFFRNPRRYIVDEQSAITAPADGKLVEITDVMKEPITGKSLRRVSIFLSVLDVHTNRYPVSGKIEKVHYNPGKFLAAFNEKASTDNEQQSTVIKADNNDTIVVTQIAGLIARRIVCYAKEGEQACKGQLMGLIRFGSRVDLWLPESYNILVKPGQRIRSGETIMALSVDASEKAA